MGGLGDPFSIFLNMEVIIIVNVYTKPLIEDEEPLKKCSNCGELKPISEFHKQKNTNDGLRSECKICRKEYRENNYVRRWCTRTIYRHKTRGYIVNMTIDELYNIVKDEPICEICGKELEWYSTGKGKPTNLSPSLDRKNNENEINKDNISILCHKCNAKKNSESIEENVIWCKQFIEYANNILGDN